MAEHCWARAAVVLMCQCNGRRCCTWQQDHQAVMTSAFRVQCLPMHALSMLFTVTAPWQHHPWSLWSYVSSVLGLCSDFTSRSWHRVRLALAHSDHPCRAARRLQRRCWRCGRRATSAARPARSTSAGGWRPTATTLPGYAAGPVYMHEPGWLGDCMLGTACAAGAMHMTGLGAELRQ